MNALRWIAVAPAAIFGWYIALAVGLMLYSGIESLCPAEEMISGMCTAWWFRYADASVFCIGAALAAFLVVMLAALTAPSRRIVVARAVFAIGCVVAVYLAWQASATRELIAAIIGGLIAVVVVFELDKTPSR